MAGLSSNLFKISEMYALYRSIGRCGRSDHSATPSSSIFDFIPANREPNLNPASAKMQGEILCSSSLDTQGFAFWTRMPNLELFADAGFPFMQLADLSETIVVLPSSLSAK